jgi:hypothetical protein
MATVRKGFESAFNRRQVDQRAERERRLAAEGISTPPSPAPELPRLVGRGRATRPDLYPAFAAGVNSASTRAVVPSGNEYVGGTNSMDVNKHPEDKVATSGADQRAGKKAQDRELLDERPRKRRTPSSY